MEDLDDLLAQEKAMRQEQQDDDEQQERNVRQRSFGNVPLAQQAGPSQAGPSQQAGYSSPPRADTRAADAQPLGDDAPLDPLQQAAVNSALSGENIFLTGGPGTGKSFTLRRIIKRLRRKHGDVARAQALATDNSLMNAISPNSNPIPSS